MTPRLLHTSASRPEGLASEPVPPAAGDGGMSRRGGMKMWDRARISVMATLLILGASPARARPLC